MHYLDGCPGLVRVVDGEEWFIRFELVQVKFENSRANSHFAVPDHPLVDAQLKGGAFWFRLTATREEMAAGEYPTAKVRPVPECDAHFQRVFGLREDTESMHHNLKDCLCDDRARSIGLERQRSDMRGYRSRSNLMAARAWMERTGHELPDVFLPDPTSYQATGPPLAA